MAMVDLSGYNKLHVVFLPFFTPSHIIPLVDSARLFAGNGVKVSIITTPCNASLFQKSVDYNFELGQDISILNLKFPAAEMGLPEGIENFSAATTMEDVEQVYGVKLMAEFNSSLATGASTVKPPLFDARNYHFWKFRMETYLKGTNPLMWTSTVKGPLAVPEESPENMSEADLRKFKTNGQALTTILCALTQNEYAQVMGLETAHEVWKKLEVLYEGTVQVQKIKVQNLVQEYENFKMLKGEDIKAMMIRFNSLIGQMSVLGKVFSEEDRVTKILRSLPSKDWRPLITAIYEAKDLSLLRVDELVGNLCTYEMTLAGDEKENPRKVVLVYVPPINL